MLVTVPRFHSNFEPHKPKPDAQEQRFKAESPPFLLLSRAGFSSDLGGLSV